MYLFYSLPILECIIDTFIYFYFISQCQTLCNPMDCSMPGFPVHHRLPEHTQTHVRQFGDAIQPSHPLLFHSPPTFNLSQRQHTKSQFFASGGQSIGVSAKASVPAMNIQDWFPLGWTGWSSLQSKGLSRVFSSTTVQKHQFFITLWNKSIRYYLFFKLEKN